MFNIQHSFSPQYINTQLIIGYWVLFEYWELVIGC